MSVNQISSTTNSYETGKTKTSSSKTNAANKTASEKQSSAAVYEKSNNSTDSTEKLYHKDNATVQKLKQEAEKRTQSLRELVEKLMLKQGKTFNASTDIYSLLREGKLEVDADTKAQAQKDISENGYWGINQTSDRLVSFAKALTGGDPSKADKMIAAVKKGFEQAKKAWGGELPQICQSTIDSAIKKLEDWRDSVKDSSSMADTVEDTIKNQAASGTIAQ